MSKFIFLKSLPTILQPIKRLIDRKAQDVDWNENDPASPGYIANRTHYKAMEKAYWWKDQNVVFEQIDTSIFFTQGPDPLVVEFEPSEIIVIYDGYEYKSQLNYNDSEDCFVVGNVGPIGSGDDTGEPFCWLFYPNEFSGILAYTSGSEHTISIYAEGEVVYKIPEEYLPETGVGKKYNNSGEIFNDYESNIASSNYSHAEGENTIASGYAAHAEGQSTQASHIASHAEGYSTIASGEYSHAEGWGAQATGTASHAENCETIASGAYSHAEGFNTEARGECQHVQGLYNLIDNSNTYLHIVGNGESTRNTDGSYTITRSNAHTLDRDGNAWFQGDVYVGSTSGTDKDEGSKKLITQAEVEDYVSITEADIDEICGGALVSEVAY